MLSSAVGFSTPAASPPLILPPPLTLSHRILIDVPVVVEFSAVVCEHADKPIKRMVVVVCGEKEEQEEEVVNIISLCSHIIPSLESSASHLHPLLSSSYSRRCRGRHTYVGGAFSNETRFVFKS